MKNKTYPKSLYHYTSIERLAIILKNRSIRFSRANKVNDLDEVVISDVPEIKKCVFLSCWSASKKESIPLWALYGSRMKGVRIELVSAMFKSGSEPRLSKCGKFFIVNLLTLKNLAQRKKDRHWVPYLFGPSEVKYTDKNQISVMNGRDIDVSKIGVLKLEHWKFEEEYRYIIFPTALWNPEAEVFQFYNDIKDNPITDESIYIPIDKNILDNIIVTLGPNASDSEYCRVDALLKKYTKNGQISYSELRDKVKISL